MTRCSSRALGFVLLRFDEPVETAFGAIRVYDARAHRVDSGEVERPSEKEARIALDRRLAQGTYTVTWRAVSADGHPVSGAFVFHVGAPGANPGRRRGAGARRRDAALGDDRRSRSSGRSTSCCCSSWAAAR